MALCGIAPHRIALHCIALHCMVFALHGFAYHGVAWHCVTWHCIAWHCITMHFIALHGICIVRYCIALCGMALCGIVLNYMAQHGVTWYCIALHCIHICGTRFLGLPLRFVQGQILAPHRGLGRLKDTAGVQKPFAAFLSCADSRVPVEIIFDQGFGDVFIVRVAGNVASTAVIASLEFGCAVLGCKLLYVLGHTSCGAVKATMNPQAVPGVISSLYYHIRPAVENAKGDQDKAIEENVRIQCKSLGISPVITSLQEEGKLKVVGGIYDLATGKVREIDC